MKVLQEVASPKDPDAIVYDPTSKRVLAFNGDSNNATVIDASTGKFVGTIDLGGGPEFAVADGSAGEIRPATSSKPAAFLPSNRTPWWPMCVIECRRS
jgi:YVTN family beta-propeller protein